ncbi:MAG: GNAT family N-acetyltransferase [Proteobacteria bacterium]|nr:GNAT family N-acetyltransferase [Pseudomonadota bacterium]
MRDWAFANTRLRALASYIDPANQRAIALAERLGGQPVEGPPGVVTYRYCARMAEASPKRPGTEPHG